MVNTRSIRLTEKEYNFLRFILKKFEPYAQKGMTGLAARHMIEKLEKMWAEAGDFRQTK